MKSITLKFGSMRKSQVFTIYPFQEGDTKIKIQSDKTIAAIDTETGDMIYNSRQGGAYNQDLYTHDRKEAKLPKEDLQTIKKQLIGEGDIIQVGPGVIADNSGAKTLKI